MRAKIDTEDAASALAHADDEEQAKFLSAFGDALLKACRTHGGNYELQLAYISERMTARGKQVMADLAGYCGKDQE